MNRSPGCCFCIVSVWTLLVAGSASAACLAPPSGLVSWWPGDANANDIQDGNSGALQNGATFAAGKVGPAFSLDGTNDFVLIPHNSNLNPTGAFSVDAWIKANPVQLSGDGQFLIVDKSHGFADGTGWALQGNPNGTVAFLFGKGGGTGDPGNFPFVNTSSNLLDNQWHHLAGVFTGSRLEIYLDGALQNTTAFSGTPVSNTRDVSIGRSWGGGTPTRHFRGLIDEVEFFNRALTSNEVAAIFLAGSDGKCKPCAPPPPGMVSWWPGDGNPGDILGTNHGTLQNGATFTAGTVGAAFSFDGVDDLVSVADAPNLRFGPTSPMTVDLWVFRTSSNTRQHFVGKRAGCSASSTEGTFQLHLNTDNPGEGLGFANPGGSCACSGQNLPLNAWTHLAGTFDGTTLRLFINGQLAATTAGSLGPSNTAPLLIGGSGGCEKFGGLIDEVEIFNRALSSNEIAAIYAAGSAGKCKTPALRIIAIAREGNDIRVIWSTTGGTTNQLQAVNGGPGGSFTNNFADLGSPIVINGSGSTTTNRVDVGVATNTPARYYRVRQVP